ncbi:MAG: hypothetical protein AAFU71_18065 [Cyanobacteria bacterium J06632_22]
MQLRTNTPVLPPYTRTDLSDEYCRLEGITPQVPQPSWSQAVSTIAVVLGLLAASSVTLGLAVHHATMAAVQLTEYVMEDSVDELKTPTSWRF